jgi:ketosteroid isomerase-like protein
MSTAEIERLRAIYEAVSRGDWDTAFRGAPPDFELVPPDTNPIAGTYRGRAEIGGFFEELWAAFEEVDVEPEEFLESGDRIVAFLHLQFQPKDSTAMMQMRVAHVWTMRDGEAVRCQVFREREEALEAAGLSEKDLRARSS